MAGQDPRLGDVLKAGSDGDVVLLGMPFDEGVRRNGGRPGAAQGPAAVRAYLPRMGCLNNLEYNVDLRTLRLTDGGDAQASTLEEAHEVQVERVAAVLRNRGVPFIVGGGNDQSYANACAALETLTGGEHFGVINLDAHLDVRPLIDDQAHSGSPFRQLLLDPRFDEHQGTFVEFAAQGSQCSHEHVKFVQEHGGRIMWLSDIAADPVAHFKETLDTLGDRIFVSFDLDCISGADAPGVSCVATVGLSSSDALQIALAAGRDPRVIMFDVSELNPRFDDYRTPRLVVNMFYYFCIGLCLRRRDAKA